MSALDTLRLRPFDPRDALLEGHGRYPEHPAVGVTAIMSGRPIGYAGVHKLGDKHWAFFFLTIRDGALLKAKAPLWLHRIVYDGLEAVTRSGISEVYVLCDDTYPKARAWLTALGFVEMAEHEKSDDVKAHEALCGGSAWIRRKGTGER